MGYSLQIGPDRVEDLASLAGYGEFIDWVGALPEAEAPALYHLCRYGWEEDLDGLREQLSKNAKAHPPKKADVASTVKHFADLLADTGDAHVVSVTDGMGPGSGEE